MVNRAPQQGDIIAIDLDPRMGHEQQGFRPVIILSNNIVSQYTHVVIVAPISTTQHNAGYLCIITYPTMLPLREQFYLTN